MDASIYSIVGVFYYSIHGLVSFSSYKFNDFPIVCY